MKPLTKLKLLALRGITNRLIIDNQLIKKSWKQKTENRKLFLLLLTINIGLGTWNSFAQVNCTAVITGTTALCKNDSTILFAAAAQEDTSYKYTWSTGDTTTSITVKPSATTPYWVVISNGSCSDTAFSTVQVTTIKAGIISVDSVLCKGSSTSLTASGGTKYVWNTGDTTAILIANPIKETSYLVTAFDCGCQGTAQTSIKVNPVPLIHAEKDTAVAPGSSVSLSASGTGIVNYLWTPSTGLNNATVFNPIANPQTTITYVVIGTDGNGCMGMDSVLITLLEAQCVVQIPNAFSPNADGKNDLLKAHGDCFKEFSLSIYDRWGEKVFETKDINTGWDGTYKGKPMNTAVFVYYITATQADGLPISQKGNISLIR